VLKAAGLAAFFCSGPVLNGHRLELENALRFEFSDPDLTNCHGCLITHGQRGSVIATIHCKLRLISAPLLNDMWQ